METQGWWLLWDCPQPRMMLLEEHVAITEGEIHSKTPCYMWLWQGLEEIWVAAATSVTQESLCGTGRPQVREEEE